MFLSQIGVTEAAALLMVSPSRVRLLLGTGRIPGVKNPASGAWLIPFPFTVKPGHRGPRLSPRLRALQARKRGKRADFCTKTVAAATL